MSTEPLVIERMEGVVEGQGVIRLKGPLTTENLSSFQNAVRSEPALTVFLDLTDVPYIDSSGLGCIVSALVSSHKAGRRVVLSGVNPRVLKLFEITRVEQLFLIFPTLWDAMEALTTAGRA